jgi:RNA polymerase-binding transcription factor DksA
MSLDEIMKTIFPKEMERREKGKCPTCGEEIGPFRDLRSRREFKISGMCQNCQDGFFNDDE